jgi:hypothetical protein
MWQILYMISIFLVGTETWTQGFALVWEVLSHYSLFCFNYFSDSVLGFLLGPALNHDFPTYTSCVTRIRIIYYHHVWLVSLYIFFSWWDCDLNSGLCIWKTDALFLSHTSKPFCFDYFGDGGLMNYFLGLAVNCDSPNLSFSSRWAYKCEQLVSNPACSLI